MPARRDRIDAAEIIGQTELDALEHGPHQPREHFPNEIRTFANERPDHVDELLVDVIEHNL